MSNRFSSRIFTLFAAAGLIALPATVAAQAGAYYLDARNSNNGIDVALLSGAWTIGVSNGGWSPWNYVSGCDGDGTNCHTGFHTVFYYTVSGGPLTQYGWDGSQREQYIPNHVSDFFRDPDMALAHAFAPFRLDLDAPATLHLSIPDCCYYDNTGGLEITVAAVPMSNTTVPEPSSFALSGIGLALAAFVASHRRRLNRR